MRRSKPTRTRSRGSPFFLFDVTMQNHSGYTNRYFQADINCNGYDSDEADQYFSLLKLSDEAISYLIRYFQQVTSRR